MQTDIYEKAFQSVTGLSNFLEAGWPDWEKGFQSGQSFTDCMSHDATREILSQGGHWSEGVARMKSAQIDVTKIPLSESSFALQQLSVVGHRPSVPAFMAGAPMSMVRNLPETRPDRRVRMLVSVCASAGVKHEILLNRGAAIMGAIDQLCGEGYAVELTVGFFIESDDKQVHLTTRIKDFQDTYNPAALAFVLGEPSFFRRALFALFNILQVQQPDNKAIQAQGYTLGAPVTGLFEKLDYDIVYDSLHLHDGWTKANAADKAMERVYNWLARTGKGL